MLVMLRIYVHRQMQKLKEDDNYFRLVLAQLKQFRLN